MYQTAIRHNPIFQSPAFNRWTVYIRKSCKPYSVFAFSCQHSQPASDNHAVNETSSAHHATDRTLHVHLDILQTRNLLHFLRHPSIPLSLTPPTYVRYPALAHITQRQMRDYFSPTPVRSSPLRQGRRLGAIAHKFR